MALRFFKDAALRIPITEDNPLWVFASLNGNLSFPKHCSVWLGDDTTTYAASAAPSANSTLSIRHGNTLSATRACYINGHYVTFTSTDADRMLGISGLPAVSAGDPIFPLHTYSGSGSLTVWPAGSGAGPDSFQIVAKRPDQSVYGFPGTPLLYSFSDTPSVGAGGFVSLAKMDLETRIPAGAEFDFANYSFTVSLTLVESGAVAIGVLPVRVCRRNQGVGQRFRIFEKDRILKPGLSGFVLGSYLWRDKEQINQKSLVPWQWDSDISSIPNGQFSAGIGCLDDLQLLKLEKSTDPASLHSVFARIRGGNYFTGKNGYYFPAEPVLDILPANEFLTLSKTPKLQTPIYVGTFRSNREGYFDADLSFRYVSGDVFDSTIPGPQFLIDRKTNRIRVSLQPQNTPIYLGAVKQEGLLTLSIPTYPLYSVSGVYLAAGGGYAETVVPFSFDKISGLLTVTYPTGSTGRDVFVKAIPGFAVFYHEKTFKDVGSFLLDSIDLNPAFAGISHGYIYCEHRKHRSGKVTLSVDKPLIVTPPSFQNVLGLVAFGPVYAEGDYALLQAAAYSSDNGLPVPGVTLRIVPGTGFSGLVNYKDPRSQVVKVKTGGDGAASFIYTPPSVYGVYLDTGAHGYSTHLTLPVALPFADLYNAVDGWLIRTFLVMNDNPYFGKVGADTSLGEVPFETFGTTGTSSFKSNGRRVLWSVNNNPVIPSTVFDSNGVQMGSVGFNGTIKVLSYSLAVPSSSNVGAYFISYVGQIRLSVQAEDSNIQSNSILLQLTPPPDALDPLNGYLILNNIQGRIEANRLGGAAIVPAAANTSRY